MWAKEQTVKGQRGFDHEATYCSVITVACRCHTNAFGELLHLFNVQRALLKEARMLKELLPPTGGTLLAELIGMYDLFVILSYNTENILKYFGNSG